MVYLTIIISEIVDESIPARGGNNRVNANLRSLTSVSESLIANTMIKTTSKNN